MDASRPSATPRWACSSAPTWAWTPPREHPVGEVSQATKNSIAAFVAKQGKEVDALAFAATVAEIKALVETRG